MRNIIYTSVCPTVYEVIQSGYLCGNDNDGSVHVHMQGSLGEHINIEFADVLHWLVNYLLSLLLCSSSSMWRRI